MQTTDTRQSAMEGNTAAQVELAKMLLARENYDEAASWLRKAADSGDEEAQFLYGSMLAEGLGVDYDQEAAAYWLKMAAEHGHTGAQVLLAESFQSGAGVAVNHALAAQWYFKAAQQGDSIAQLRYGLLLHFGEGVEKDTAAAIDWLRKAANQGCTAAQVKLVECLMEAPNYDAAEALKWAKLAADADDVQAKYLLASLHERSSPPDVEQALAWYRKAAEQGSGDAQFRLGKLYAEGKIVAQDQSEAERWLSSAIADGRTSVAPDLTGSGQLGALAPFVTVNEYPPGSIIDKKYFIMSILGKGGMCVVYKAKHLLMNKMVALKMLLPESAANAGLAERFQREAQAASSLNHPNIITIYDLGISPDGKPFMVMDYLEGESLEQRISSCRSLPLKQFVPIMTQICAALEVAHEAGIIHRDIKPANIMLIDTKAQADFVKVLDFGLAKMMDSSEEAAKLTKSGEVFGTLMYMSPEQCLGHPLDKRTDIYSVGCTMYEAITGIPVHRGTSPYDLMSKQINSPPAPFATAAPHLALPELERMIMKALAKNREERYQAMSELHADLLALHKSNGS